MQFGKHLSSAVSPSHQGPPNGCFHEDLQRYAEQLRTTPRDLSMRLWRLLQDEIKPLKLVGMGSKDVMSQLRLMRPPPLPVLSPPRPRCCCLLPEDLRASSVDELRAFVSSPHVVSDTALCYKVLASTKKDMVVDVDNDVDVESDVDGARDWLISNHLT